jgi:hypothetical protein
VEEKETKKTQEKAPKDESSIQVDDQVISF